MYAGKVPTKMTDAAVIAPELSLHWVKRLARMLNVPLKTAESWRYRGLPDTRRQEVAAAILLECARLRGLIEETERRWGTVANEGAEVDRAMAGKERVRADHTSAR